MADPHAISVQEHRHNETIETLRRIALGLELLNGTAERILHTIASANAQRDATLSYAIAAWQATRREGSPDAT